MLWIDNLKRKLTKKDDRPTHTEPALPDMREDDVRIVQMIRQKIELGWSLREPYARLWTYCAAFLRRGDWHDWDSMVRSAVSRRPEEMPDAITDAKSVDNHLPIYYQSYLTEFRQGMPLLRVDPPSSSEIDRLTAELANRILELRIDPDHGNEGAMRMSAVRQVLLFGEALGRIQWDPDAADGKGDVFSEVIDVFGFLKDPYSIGRWPPRYLIEMDCRHVDEVHDIYGVWVKPDTNLVEKTLYYDTLASSVSKEVWSQVRPVMRDAVMVYRFFIPACAAYPEGMCFHVIGQEIVRRHKLQMGKWPFARAAWEESELNLYPVGLIERLLQDQIKRNILTSVGFETALIKARGDLWASGPGAPLRSEVYNPRTGATVIHLPPNTIITPRETGMSFQDAAFQLDIVDSNMREKAGRPRPSLGQPLEKERTLGAQLLAHQVAATDVSERVEEFGIQYLLPIAKRTLAFYSEYAVSLREINMGPGAGMFKFNRNHLKRISTVRAVATPNMSPATKRALIIAARAQNLMPPYATARDEASSRQVLISQGLEDLERMVAEQSEPLEKILELAMEEAKLAYQAQIIQQAMAVQQAQVAMQQPPQPSPEAAAPEMQVGEKTSAGQVAEGRQQLRERQPVVASGTT